MKLRLIIISVVTEVVSPFFLPFRCLSLLSEQGLKVDSNAISFLSSLLSAGEQGCWVISQA